MTKIWGRVTFLTNSISKCLNYELLENELLRDFTFLWQRETTNGNAEWACYKVTDNQEGKMRRYSESYFGSLLAAQQVNIRALVWVPDCSSSQLFPADPPGKAEDGQGIQPASWASPHSGLPRGWNGVSNPAAASSALVVAMYLEETSFILPFK